MKIFEKLLFSKTYFFQRLQSIETSQKFDIPVFHKKATVKVNFIEILILAFAEIRW